jgi:5-deoxy-glucuronate isomerase
MVPTRLVGIEGALLRRAAPPQDGSTAAQRIEVADAGWRYVGFAAHELTRGDGFERPPDDREMAVIVGRGSATVSVDGRRFGSLGGRDGFFDGLPTVVLCAPGRAVEAWAESRATLLVAHAPGGDVGLTRVIEPSIMRVEERGQGLTARRVHHLLPPDAQAGRLILFEVLTPGGHWSSYPPHKHDTEDPPRESYLEELYYYRFARPEGWAFQRVYTLDGSLDESLAPHDGDVVLVPRGFHPVGMPAGYDGYYLNVMAGPTRAWHLSLDPRHAWLMDWDPDQPR